MRSSRRAAQLTLTLVFVTSACSSEKPKGPDIDANFDNPGSLAGKGTPPTGGAGFKPGECANGLVTTTRVTPRVTLLLDGSCSMTTNYPAMGAESESECRNNPTGRWAALRTALVDPQRGVVPRLQHVVEFGLMVYGTAGNCPVTGSPVRPQLNNQARVTAGIPQVQPGMYTPTGPALDWVYENWITAQGGPDDSSGPQIVILATDGEPNSCGGAGGGRGGGGMMVNYQPSIDAVRRGTAKGATTYVISLADATGAFHDHLQELANLGNPAAGGQAMLYEPSSPQQLEASLMSLVSAALGCELTLNGLVDVNAACSGSVKLNGSALECNGRDGWKLIDARHIQLQGQACESLKANSAALVEASFNCSVFNPD